MLWPNAGGLRNGNTSQESYPGGAATPLTGWYMALTSKFSALSILFAGHRTMQPKRKTVPGEASTRPVHHLCAEGDGRLNVPYSGLEQFKFKQATPDYRFG